MISGCVMYVVVMLCGWMLAAMFIGTTTDKSVDGAAWALVLSFAAWLALLLLYLGGLYWGPQ